MHNKNMLLSTDPNEFPCFHVVPYIRINNRMPWKRVGYNEMCYLQAWLRRRYEEECEEEEEEENSCASCEEEEEKENSCASSEEEEDDMPCIHIAHEVLNSRLRVSSRDFEDYEEQDLREFAEGFIKLAHNDAPIILNGIPHRVRLDVL